MSQEKELPTTTPSQHPSYQDPLGNSRLPFSEFASQF